MPFSLPWLQWTGIHHNAIKKKKTLYHHHQNKLVQHFCASAQIVRHAGTATTINNHSLKVLRSQMGFVSTGRWTALPALPEDSWTVEALQAFQQKLRLIQEKHTFSKLRRAQVDLLSTGREAEKKTDFNLRHNFKGNDEIVFTHISSFNYFVWFFK